MRKRCAGAALRSVAASSKVGALGWAPASTFDAALAATVEWYRTHEAWWKPIKSGAFRQYYQTQYAARA